MEHKIFLGKYRVAADEIALISAEPVGGVAVAEQHQTSVVYRGEEIESGRDVAIEVIPAGAFKAVVREELEAEALAAKKINHVNIPGIYDFGVEDDDIIYVAEYFDGTSAQDWVNQHGPMPTGAVLRIAQQVVGAMGAAGFHRISHHAINPANLLLVPGQTPEGDWPLVKVLHFVGVAPTFSSADTSVASFDKSSHYASPEQLQNGTVDFRSEIYSLGATMWFLLTGAPPLIAPNGPLAMQPTTNGLAVDKLNGMPKKVRRLLSQMLSVKPEDRPQDPLAFYRQIQDCVVQVDRRETMARRFGIPIFSRSNVVEPPSRRRFPAKALAIAAVLLAIAALAALVLPGYLRHQRVRQAEEPIGVPIGVPDATAPAPPAVTAQSSQNPPEQKAVVPPVSDASPVTATNEVASAPAQPLPTAPLENVQPKEPPKVAEAAVKPLPTAPPEKIQSEEVPQVAANDAPALKRETADPKPTESVHAEEPVIEAKRETEVAAIPTARPVAPEVRRAEPAPAGEGPEEVAATTESKVAPSAQTKKERLATTKRRPEKEAMRETRVANEDEETDAPPPPLPRGRVKAKFIGVAADGNWMFELPGHKIVTVPAPPGG